MNFKEYMLNKIEESQDFEINEVRFSEKNLTKVALLYGKIMGKQMGGVFKPFGIESFKRKTGEGKGIRMMNNQGYQLRFNWDYKKSKKSQYDLTSIDYWDKDNLDFSKPSRTIMFSPDLNTIQVLGKIVGALKTGHITEAVTIIEEANIIIEKKRSGKEKSEWLKSKGLRSSMAGSMEKMRDEAESAGLLGELEIFLGQPETNTFVDGLNKADKLMDTTIYADPDTVFDELEDLTQMVASGFSKSLVITGMGGILRNNLLVA